LFCKQQINLIGTDIMHVLWGVRKRITCKNKQFEILEYLDEKVQVMVLENQILPTLSQDVAVGVSGLGFAASSAVLEPDIHLPGLNSQLPSKIGFRFLVTIGPLE
jgi:hypothetical protein